ncbi:MAG TPA: hypothetical protein VER11_21050 [Polyangiaceae bacterium]|nr:hypothetical protein [Polyangiaceae bacterium]
MIDFVTRLTHLGESMKNAVKISLLPLGLLFFCGAPACGGSSDSDVPSPGTGTAGASAAGAPGSVGSAGAGSASTGASGAATTGSAGASNSTAGSAAVGGATGAAGGGNATSTAGSTGTSGATGAAGAASPSSTKFSFFVTSMSALQAVSGNPNGFGGDLRFGETGSGAGLRGADKICSTIADRSMPGNGKAWRAFLSAVDGGDGKQVNAIDRIGAGPWYDRLGRLVANNAADLANTRPVGADAAIAKDLPNEDGIPNHQPDPTQPVVDNHDTLTGSDATGKLYNTDLKFTCNDWTTNEATTWGSPRVGHSWPRTGGPGGMGGGMSSGDSWISALDESGCGAGYHITTNDDGPPSQSGTTVGDGGGYGGFYCFALTP